jgi:hypothetical protein
MERNEGGGGVVAVFRVDFDSGRRDFGEEGADDGRDRLFVACILILSTISRGSWLLIYNFKAPLFPRFRAFKT